MSKFINSIADFNRALLNTGAYDGSELEEMGYTFGNDFYDEVEWEADRAYTYQAMYDAGVF